MIQLIATQKKKNASDGPFVVILEHKDLYSYGGLSFFLVG